MKLQLSGDDNPEDSLPEPEVRKLPTADNCVAMSLVFCDFVNKAMDEAVLQHVIRSVARRGGDFDVEADGAICRMIDDADVDPTHRARHVGVRPEAAQVVVAPATHPSLAGRPIALRL